MINTDPGPTASIVTPTATRSVVRFMDSQARPALPSNVKQVFRRREQSPEHQGAALLLSVADIVSKEITADGVDWGDDIYIDPPPLTLVNTENIHLRNSQDKNADVGFRPRPTLSALSRIRSVSVDLSDDSSSQDSPPVLGLTISKSSANVISPYNSPISRRTPRRKNPTHIKPFTLNKPCEMPTKKAVQAKGALNGKSVKTILRKKFSWKNYPEVRIPYANRLTKLPCI